MAGRRVVVTRPSFASRQVISKLRGLGAHVIDSPLIRIEYVEAAARTIGGRLKRDDLVVLRSTVPVGVTRNVVLPVLEAESGLKAGDGFLLSFAPERTVEGNALPELRQLPQVVGGFDKFETSDESMFLRMKVWWLHVLGTLGLAMFAWVAFRKIFRGSDD